MRLLRTLVLAFCLLLVPGLIRAQSGAPVVVFETSKGMFMVLLDPDKAPATVANFLTYVKKGFYDGTIFHRVINKREMGIVQGGGFDATFSQKPTNPPIKCESRNGLANKAGTIAMARTSVPDSATSQFFINTKDNDFLNFRSPDPQGMGYAVFGKVIRGMNVVQDIAQLRTISRGMMDDVPAETVLIRRAYIYQEQ